MGVSSSIAHGLKRITRGDVGGPPQLVNYFYFYSSHFNFPFSIFRLLIFYKQDKYKIKQHESKMRVRVRVYGCVVVFVRADGSVRQER